VKLYFKALLFGLKVLLVIAIFMVMAIPAALAYMLDQIFDSVFRRLTEWVEDDL